MKGFKVKIFTKEYVKDFNFKDFESVLDFIESFKFIKGDTFTIFIDGRNEEE